MQRTQWLKLWLVLCATVLVTFATELGAKSARVEHCGASHGEHALLQCLAVPLSVVSSSCAQRAAVPNSAVPSDCTAPSRRASTAKGETARPQAWPRTREWGQPMRYDAQGRCTETGGDGGYQLRKFIYEPGQTTRVIDSQGRETLYQYNDLGQVERQIDPNGATHVTEFDDAGRVAKEIDPLGAAISYEYDERGHLAKKTFPNGAALTYEYDAEHQPTKITEPDGAVWTLAYERGALVDVTDPFGRHVRYVRDSRSNQLIGALTSSGQELRVRTNDDWTEETIEDGLGVIVRRQLDVYLNATRTEDGSGPLGTADYDRLGRVVRSERPDGSARQFEYDTEGQIVRLVDARGGQWRASYSAYGDCLEQIDPIGRQHRFAWDTESRLTGITNPKGEKAHFKYDLVGNLTSIQHFDGSVEEASYDLAARLVARKRPDGTQLELERDVVGNLLKIKHGEIELRSFKYDSCGSPLEANSRDAQVLFEYAAGGRILAETQNGRRVEYEYGSRGFLTKRSFEGSKVGPLHFEHDERGRLRRFSTDSGQGQSYHYDARDQCTQRTLGRVTEKRQYDLEGRLRHQAIAGINTRTFNYDAEGALVELVDKLRGRREYKYDPADQLLSSVNSALGAHLYQYDLNGNLTAKDMAGLSYDSGNRLARMGDVTFERDANGQMVRQTSAERDDRYEWDALGQLIGVKHRDGAETRFGYDPMGRRVFKEHQAAPTKDEVEDPVERFQWAATRLPGEIGPGDRSERAHPRLESGRTDYYWVGDDLLAEARGEHLTEYAMWGFVAEALWEDGELRHVVTSQQGVPQELVDDRGKLVWQGTFDDWGKLVDERGSTTCRLRLPGQLADEETGLHYNRFRYYSAETGQFVSPDPIGFEGGTNEYRFAPNPIVWTDELGLSCGEDGCTTPPGKAGRLPRALRNKMKRIRNQTAAGGNRGISGAVSAADARRLGQEFVGPGHRAMSNGRGLVSEDGLRTFRDPSPKRGVNPVTGEAWSRTGTQVNFETKPAAGEPPSSNVHLDVLP